MATSIEPSATMEAFIVAVRESMDEQEISTLQLSRITGLDRAGLHRLIHGKGGSCTFQTADIIAKALKTSTFALLKKKCR